MSLLSRRKLITGQWRRPASALRPPWSIDEAAFIQSCTRCQACIAACETGVLIAGGGDFPEIDFQRAECSFCQRCVSACEAPVFHSPDTPPWQQLAGFAAHCLAHQGVECRSCQDSCETNAIRFKPRLGGVAQPELIASACSGCGACVANCPVQAVTVTRSVDEQ